MSADPVLSRAAIQDWLQTVPFVNDDDNSLLIDEKPPVIAGGCAVVTAQGKLRSETTVSFDQLDLATIEMVARVVEGVRLGESVIRTMRFDEVTFDDRITLMVARMISIVSTLQTIELVDCVGTATLLNSIQREQSPPLTGVRVVSTRLATSIPLAELICLLARNGSLTQCSLEGLKGDSFEMYCGNLAQVLGKCVNLTSVNLDGIWASPAAAGSLAKALQSLSKLETLSLANGLSMAAYEGVDLSSWGDWAPIMKSTSLRSLSLRGASREPGVNAFFSCPPPNLAQVDLSNAIINGSTPLISLIEKGRGLERLNLSGVRMTKIHLSAVLKAALKSNRKMTVVLSGKEAVFDDETFVQSLAARLPRKKLMLEFPTGENPFDKIAASDGNGLCTVLNPVHGAGLALRRKAAFRKAEARPASGKRGRKGLDEAVGRGGKKMLSERPHNRSPGDDLIERIRKAPCLTDALFNDLRACIWGKHSLPDKLQKAVFLALLEKLGFRQEAVKADGSCLFHAVALWQKLQESEFGYQVVAGDRELGYGLRAQTINYMRQYAEEFRIFIGEPTEADMLRDAGLLRDGAGPEEIAALLQDEDLMDTIRVINERSTLEGHLSRLEIPETHADQYEIEALSRMLQVRIVIYSKKFMAYLEDGKMCGMPVHGADSGYEKQITLLHDGGHFDLLV